MKRLLLIMALGMFSLLCAQITSTLELTNIGTFGVSGVLTIVNNNSTPITWHFSDTGDFEILVDGVGSSEMHGPMSHSITIEPYESYVTDISNSRIYPYSPELTLHKPAFSKMGINNPWAIFKHLRFPILLMISMPYPMSSVLQP
jgi:hypothetical protein